MKRLFHLSTIPRQLGWFEEDWHNIEAFIKKNKMEGIEVGLTPQYPLEEIPTHMVQGVHLSFYPMWLDFWKGNLEKVGQVLGSQKAIEEYYGGYHKEILVESYKLQYERAKKLGAKYMVFHISHVLTEDTFTFTYTYSDEEVISASIELINEIFEEEEGPMLLFENLWWPGLTYLQPHLVKRLLEQVKYPRKGLVLDISHLILTNHKIATEIQAFNYIKKVIDGLGSLKEAIKVVHLNKTLPKHYMQRDHSYTLEKYRQTQDQHAKNRILKNHIQNMDPHQPFDHEIAKEILKLVDPDFCVYETSPSSVYELAYFIKKQNTALDIK